MGIDTQVACVIREIKRRKASYPHLVEKGRMDRDHAELEIIRMQAVLETLTQLRGLTVRG